MALGMEVGLSPGHVVLDADPAPLPQKGAKLAPNFRPIFSEREFTLTFAICCRPSVCRLSVTLVHPSQAVEIFGNFSTPFGTLAKSSKLLTSTKIIRRSSQGNPSVGAFKRM